jgi:hypothetical protein
MSTGGPADRPIHYYVVTGETKEVPSSGIQGSFKVSTGISVKDALDKSVLNRALQSKFTPGSKVMGAYATAPGDGIPRYVVVIKTMAGTQGGKSRRGKKRSKRNKTRRFR